MDRDKLWTVQDFKNYQKNIGVYGDLYICENFGRKGSHLAMRTFAAIETEWETIKQLSNQEVVNALEAGIEGWARYKPKIKVKCEQRRIL